MREPEIDVPDWPLLYLTPRELELWAAMWRKPQAIIWRDFHLAVEVAVYVRTLAEVELPNAQASRRALAGQQAASLLLTHSALARAGYRIAGEGETGTSARPSSRTRTSSRARLRAVVDE